MKEIKAYLRPLCVGRVIKDLEGAGAKDLTLIRVDTIAPPPYRGEESEATFANHITRYSAIAKLELGCRNDGVKLFVEIIRAGAHSGAKGDGRIFVSRAEEGVNIRTGETGETAL